MAKKRIITMLIGALMAFAVVSYFGLTETVTALVTANLGLVALAVILEFFYLYLLVLRIQILTYGHGYLPFWHAARITISAMFLAMITPTKLGGEPLKMYMLRQSVGSSNASAAVAVESLIETLSSICFVLAVAIFFFNDIPAAFVSGFIIFLLIIGFALGVIIKILFTPHWLHRIVNWFANKISKIIEVEKKDYATMFSLAFYGMWRNKKKVVGVFSVSVIMKMIEILRFWIIFYAVGAALPFKFAVIVWTVMLVTMFIPWLPGSLGLLEFGGITALIVLGLSPSTATSGMVLDRFISFWLLLVVGFAALSVAKSKGELPELGKIRKIDKKKSRMKL